MFPVALLATVAAAAISLPACSDDDKEPDNQPPPGKTTEVEYDSFTKAGGTYTMADYSAKWVPLFGPGETAVNDTRKIENGVFSIEAVPFKTTADLGTLDHIKYMGVSDMTKPFVVPAKGSVMFSMDIKASTPGTHADGHTITGKYTSNDAPYSGKVLEGQQAAVTIHLVDPLTGQLFDWFVSEHRAFGLYERLPSEATTAPPATPPKAGDPKYVGRDQMFTQIVKEVTIEPGSTHNYALRYARDANGSSIEYLMDGNSIAKVEKVGVPLDKNGGSPVEGQWPSLGNGEILKDKINALVLAHGLFSLLDAFPYQHSEVPDKAVSIPKEQRLFGQGAHGWFSHAKVVTVELP